MPRARRRLWEIRRCGRAGFEQPQAALLVGRLPSRPPTSRIVGSTLGWFAALDAALQRDGSDVPEVQDFHEQYLLAQRSMKQLAAGP